MLALRDLVPKVSLELVAPRSDYELRPLSVLGPFALGATPAIDLERFASEHDVLLRRDTLLSVNGDERSFRTGKGETVSYEALIVAVGATPLEAVPGALTFSGPRDERRLGLLVEEYVRRELRRLAFAVPTSAVWSLPIYELALMTAGTLAGRGIHDAELTVVTPEPAPLHLFGRRASDATAELLAEARIAVRTGTHPQRLENGVLTTAPGDDVRADRVVALPRLVGPAFPGLPGDRDGFIPVDDHGAVAGVPSVYAAGDATNFSLKQGGIATQQADAAAEAIAARLGAEVEPQPFRPVLRGVLLTGRRARYMEADVAGGGGEGAPARTALWSPSSKVVGRYLLPYLTEASSIEELLAEGEDHEVISVELDAQAVPKSVLGGQTQ